MIHIRTDNQPFNDKATFACGLGPDLPKGDTYFFEAESYATRLADCPGCNPHPRQLGTPISELSGQPGHEGFGKFRRIAQTWGLP